jgi:general secretion pathway protein D
VRHAWVAAALAVALAGCASVQTESQTLIDQGRIGEGLAHLESALRERPRDVDLRIAWARQREQAVGRLLLQATAEAVAERGDAATALYDQVLKIDPGNTRATAGLAALEAARRHAVLTADARARLAAGDALSAELMVRAVLAENPQHAAAADIERTLRERERQSALTVPALKSRMQSPVSLEFRDAPLRLVMEALARSAGINFLFDREVRADLRASIFVRGVRVEDALDLIIQNLQLEKKVLSENTVLVYPSTPQKLREHQELVIRTFALGNADAKTTLNLLRTMLKTKDLYVDERSNLVVMRDTPDAVRAAEKLIAAQDRADAEVVLELEILEASRSKVRDLGISYPTTLTGPGGSLADIKQLSSRTIGVDSGYGLKLLRTDGDTRTLANPRVRVRNREKARVHVGDRVPVISSTIVGTSTGGGNASVPVTTEQIQYLDVGIKIEVEPTIHADDSVAIRINLDVSSLGTQIKTNAGTTAYEVGTRNAQTVLRLRDGETQALMGLIRDDEVSAGAGLPFIGEAPLLDRVFGNKRTEQRSRELVLLITPRLVRGIERQDATLAEFWSGTEAAVRVRTPFVQPVGKDAAALGAAPTLTPAVAAATATAAAPATAAPPPLLLSWQSAGAAKAGQPMAVELKGRSEGALRGASVQLRYDPEALEVLGVEDGGFFTRVGGAAVFTPRVDPTLGVVFVTLGASGAGSTAGDGALLRLNVRPRRAGPATLSITSAVAVDAASRRVPIEGTAQPLELK